VLERLEGAERRGAIPADEIVAWMGLRSGDVVLDLGAGTGYFSLALARRGAQVVALDIEPRMSRLLRSRLDRSQLEAVSPILGDVAKLPIASGSVDRVLLSFVYHEVGDPCGLMDECWRMLKAGGRLTVVDFQKRDTPFGPPVRERKTPEDVLAAAMSRFEARSRRETDVYYQLELVKKG